MKAQTSNPGGPDNTKHKSNVHVKWVKERKKERKQKATFVQHDCNINSSIWVTFILDCMCEHSKWPLANVGW